MDCSDRIRCFVPTQALYSAITERVTVDVDRRNAAIANYPDDLLVVTAGRPLKSPSVGRSCLHQCARDDEFYVYSEYNTLIEITPLPSLY